MEVVPNRGGGNHVVGRFACSGKNEPVLVLTHFDTVWPAGTLARMPVREADGRFFGPGAYDMKASLVMLFAALEVLQPPGLEISPARHCSGHFG